MKKPSQNKSYIKFENKIIKAFISLFSEKNESRISVNDIMKKAGVGRATFYEHFKSINDVYIGVAKWISESAFKVIVENGSFDLKNSKKIFQQMFKKIQNNLVFYRSLSYNKQLNKIVRDIAENIINGYFAKNKDIPQNKFNIKLNIISAVASLINIIAYKVRGEIDCSWDELVDWCTDLMRKIFPISFKESL